MMCCLLEQVEIVVHKIYCINRALPTLPVNIEDAARSEAGEQLVRDGVLCEVIGNVSNSSRVPHRLLPTAHSSDCAFFRAMVDLVA
ncbi:hypothetical protein Droror1_Dr00008741 [Drosera rotundifolia]